MYTVRKQRDKCWPLSQFLLFVKSQTLACDIGQSSLEALERIHPEVCLLGDFKSDQADDKNQSILEGKNLKKMTDYGP